MKYVDLIGLKLSFIPHFEHNEAFQYICLRIEVDFCGVNYVE